MRGIQRVGVGIVALGLALSGAGPAWAQKEGWWKKARRSAVRQEAPIEVEGKRRGKGVIDWSDGYIEVTARGYADPSDCLGPFHCRGLAERAAKTLAYAELGRIIDGVNVNAATNVGNMVLRFTAARTWVKAFVRGARKIGPTKFAHDPPGSKNVYAEVTMGVLIQGGLTRGILRFELEKPKPKPEEIYQPEPPPEKPQPPPVSPPPKETRPTPKPSPPTPPPPPREDEPLYTGLIVDASGLGAEFALAPQLRTPPRPFKIFYGPYLVDREVALNYGLAGYAQSEKEAREKHRERIGDAPLVVKGQGVYGSKRTDILVNEEDSRRVVLADHKGNFLRKARVVIVNN